MRLLFVRHGQTDDNARGLIQGRNDPPLNDNGLAQAERIAEILSHQDVSCIISSPLKRALQTADIISQKTGLVIELDDRLVERDFGLLQNHTYEDLNKHPATGQPDFLARDYEEFGAEPICDMIERVTDFLRDLSRRQEAAVLIVAHGGIGYCFDHLLTDTELPQVALNGQVQHYTLSNKKE